MTDDLLLLAEDARATEILELWHSQRAAFEQEGIGIDDVYRWLLLRERARRIERQEQQRKQIKADSEARIKALCADRHTWDAERLHCIHCGVESPFVSEEKAAQDARNLYLREKKARAKRRELDSRDFSAPIRLFELAGRALNASGRVEYRHPDSYEFQDNTYWERSRFRHHFHHDR